MSTRPNLTPSECVLHIDEFIKDTDIELNKLQDLKKRLESDENFQNLWKTDRDVALTTIGIDPNARNQIYNVQENQPPGPECLACWTPSGKACHC